MERNILKKYLRWAGFTLKAEKARFVVRFWMDMAVVTIYSVICIILIWIQQADGIVLGLNILCLLRAIISNTILASEVTKKNEKSDIEEKREKNGHYHSKALMMAVFFVIAVSVFVILWYEKNSASFVIKFLAILAIAVVMLNDWEANIVYAYNASIEPTSN